MMKYPVRSEINQCGSLRGSHGGDFTAQARARSSRPGELLLTAPVTEPPAVYTPGVHTHGLKNARTLVSPCARSQGATSRAGHSTPSSPALGAAEQGELGPQDSARPQRQTDPRASSAAAKMSQKNTDSLVGKAASVSGGGGGFLDTGPPDWDLRERIQARG